MEFLFKIKSEGGPASQIAKRIINIIWGALCQRNYTYEPESDSFSIPEGAVVKEFQPVGYRKVLFKLSYSDNVFRGKYSRYTWVQNSPSINRVRTFMVMALSRTLVEPRH